MPTNKRAQMIKGSIWRVTQDATIEHRGPNPAFTNAVNAKERELNDAWYAQNGGLRDSWGGYTNRMSTAEYEANERKAKAHAKSLGIPETKLISTVDINAGETIEITGPSTNNYYGSGFTPHTGIYYPVKIGTREGWLPYAGFEPIVELVQAVTVEEWVIRDSATGLFYANYDRNSGPNWTYTYQVNYTDKFMKAKRFKDIGKAKMGVMNLDGYYDNMPGSENLPDWIGGPKVLDIPETWEFVKFDKITKTEVETVDLQAWHKRLWELRALTIQFGSPVRTLYNDLDKKGKLDEFHGMLVVRAPLETSKYNPADTYYADELDPKAVEEVDAVVAGLGLKKADIKRAKDLNCVAIVFKDVNTALKLKLSYNGKLNFNVLDLNTLKEVVND